MTKDNFDNYLQKFNLNKKDLANLLSLPYGTVNNWNGISKPFPSWLNSWFYYYEKSLKFDKIKELLKDEI
ncbi:hypothetical protein [Campylobacter geochelonis]|uniref:Uncharacterized protein n=1 Tax=Campylobacter geochelonis TaxID=1780362 RepID=A0A128EMV6_9BACT|nr:hypothetical protein [Campylobacter geochelonis]QKF72004.1 hypothetical protein CGEO_1733 [Campylobacter geochelonis]CZE47709.1 Uncharacterised protein [Campylobacter geochelonis]CZE48933.1 Uncharacterised protein [Campylobacter geochelonis]CZE49910.1 Uncharacterised protein [Campylobacter geochelonis]